MYVSTQLTFKLDEIIKSFEVALRSYLINKIKPKFSNSNKFKNHLELLLSQQTSSSIMFSSKIENILKNFIAKHKKIYILVSEEYNDDVPYVSELINLIIIFFKELDELKKIHNNYKTVEDFLYKCTLYYRIRNDLSHPASQKILKQDAIDVLKLISKFIEELDGKYFWYISKSILEKNINNYYKEEGKKVLKYDNLRSINVSHQKTICRESELEKLHNGIIGSSEYARVSGSTIVYGYGGVGKTALVVDFIYEIIQKMQSCEGNINYDFILFFSSKDEILRTKKTTGEYYIDKLNSNINNFNDILNQILNLLELSSFENLQKLRLQGLIVIDNIENLQQNEKDKIFEMMKELPRNIQFLLTSRNEEPCEETIHLSEFNDFEKGKVFILNYINTNDFNIVLNDENIRILLSGTKGNTLLLVQALLALNDKITTVKEISANLNNYESSEFEKVVSFMYKNTFDNAIKELEEENLNPKDVILIATLYEEKIDLYALTKLTDININEIRTICKFLTSKLIFNKTQEFYSVNEFASRFIFISLMPDRRKKEKIQDNINNYKNNLKQKLYNLEKQKQKNTNIDTIITDWRPNNYIDQIVITEVFHMFKKFQGAIKSQEDKELDKLFNEYLDYEYTTKHPYVRFQKARIFNLFLSKKYYGSLTKEEIVLEINRCYEDTLESINTSYSYIKNTESHIAVLMLYGFFLNRNLQDISRSIRYLEDAKDLETNKENKKYYLLRNELYKLYVKAYLAEKDNYYKEASNKIYIELTTIQVNHSIFDTNRFKKEIQKYKDKLDKGI